MEEENVICNNTRGMPLIYKERIVHTPLIEKESVFKMKKVKEIVKPKIVKDTDVFDFNLSKHKENKKKLKENKDKRFKVKETISKKKIKFNQK